MKQVPTARRDFVLSFPSSDILAEDIVVFWKSMLQEKHPFEAGLAYKHILLFDRVIYGLLALCGLLSLGGSVLI